jgi:hypothetical protein
MAVLVQTLIDQTRLLSNLKNNLFYTDDDIGGFLGDAALELKDLFDNTYEHYFALSQDFTLAGGVGANSVALAADFEKAQILLKDPATSNPARVDPLANLHERGTGEAVPGLGRCYYISGTPAVLEILPASSAAGDYRLLYTPQLANLWPDPSDFTVKYATTGVLSVNSAGAGVGKTLTEIGVGVLTIDGATPSVSDRILVKDQTGFEASNGIYVVTNAGSGGTPYVLTRATDYDQASSTEVRTAASVKVTAGAVNANRRYVLGTFTGNVDFAAQNYAQAALPASLVPWQLFLKVHASITIIQGRKQPMPDGMQAKMEQQRQRARAAAQNRTEGVTQAPLQRRRGGWWNDMPGGSW